MGGRGDLGERRGSGVMGGSRGCGWRGGGGGSERQGGMLKDVGPWVGMWVAQGMWGDVGDAGRPQGKWWHGGTWGLRGTWGDAGARESIGDVGGAGDRRTWETPEYGWGSWGLQVSGTWGTWGAGKNPGHRGGTGDVGGRGGRRGMGDPRVNGGMGRCGVSEGQGHRKA